MQQFKNLLKRETVGSDWVNITPIYMSWWCFFWVGSFIQDRAPAKLKSNTDTGPHPSVFMQGTVYNNEWLPGMYDKTSPSSSQGLMISLLKYYYSS